MHHYSSLLLVGAALSLCSTTALPTPDSPDGPPGSTCPGGLGDHGYQYTVLAQNDVAGSSQVGDYSISGASGNGVLTQQTSYSIGVTVEVGASIGLDFDMIAGEVSGSVSYTTEKGTIRGVSDTCPQGAWDCALSITPNMVKVDGTARKILSCGAGLGDPEPYTVFFPTLGSDGNPITNAEACTCQNLKDWADPGHLALLCPGNCALPGHS